MTIFGRHRRRPSAEPSNSSTSGPPITPSSRDLLAAPSRVRSDARIEVRDAKGHLVAVRYRDRHVASEEMILAGGSYLVGLPGRADSAAIRVELSPGRTSQATVQG